MSQTIQVKQAKPSQEDFTKVIEFLETLDAYFDGRLEEDVIIDIEQLGAMWWEIDWRWRRVVYGGEMCVKALCDPNSDVVELAPWIAERERHFQQSHDDCAE